MKKQKVLVVGAGFSGAVIARQLADSGKFSVDIIDERGHIAGNCYDPYDEDNKIRIHQYGPHIFHTNNKQVVDYLSRFTQWLPYEHKVEAFVEGVGFVPFPINLLTINCLYDLNLNDEHELKVFLGGLSKRHKQVVNARQAAENIYGQELVELFFARYTRKMWDLELDELPVSLINRIPVRYDKNANYFNDKFQAMPQDGYLSLFENMLNHPNIHLYLNTAFERRMEQEFKFVFNSMAIDRYFDYEFGALPYRSIKYKHEFKAKHVQPVPTINLTDSRAFTRYTDWRLYPGGGEARNRSVITYEQPCSYESNNNERYYPIKTVDNIPQKRYKQYKKLAEKNKKLTFIGRCGQYRYLDMHQVIANSLMIADQFN